MTETKSSVPGLGRSHRCIQVVGVTVAWLILTAAGCAGESTDAFVLNQTGQAIDVYHIVDGEEDLVVSLEKPRSNSYFQPLFDSGWRYPEACTVGELVARNAEGEEVARLTEPLCIGQSWWIYPDGTSELR